MTHEPLEQRLVLDGTGFEGNPCAPDLDLSSLGVQAATVGEEISLDLYALGAVATDLDGDGNASGDTIRLQLDPDDNPTGATLTADGILSWTPTEDQLGVQEFVVLAVDEGTPPLADAEVFSIEVFEVNNAPDLAAVADVSATPGEELVITVTASDSDGDNLTFMLDRDDPDGSVPESATLTQSENGSAVIRWTPDSDDALQDFVFSVLVIDDGTPAQCDREVFTVSVGAASGNTAPVATADSYSVVSGDQLVRDASSGVLANDTDADGDDLTATLASGVSNGTLTFNSDGSFTYVPNTSYTGTDSFAYVANDGTDDSNEVTVTLTVQENQAPVGTDDEYDVIAGATLTVAAAEGVLANDSDADGQTLTASILSAPLYGTLSLESDGSFVYVASADYSGTDSFEYAASDGSASSGTVTVVVNVRANSAPVAGTETYSVNEDETLQVAADSGVLANDSDADGDSLSLSLLTGPFHGTLTLDADGSFTYTPETDYSGSDLFTYEVSDGLLTSGSTTVSLNVVAVNDAVEAYDDGYWLETNGTFTADAGLGVLANDVDIDGDTLTVSLVTGPANGSLTLDDDGSFTYTGSTDYTGVDSFVYEVTDGTDSVEAEVTLQVGTDFGPVVISEIVAGGNETYADSEGEYYDWIEIHNLSDEDIDLADWSLTDDDTDSDKWVFPSVTIEAGGYLVVFASGNDLTDPTGDLHTNFQLASGGEYLALFNAADTAATEFSPEYPTLQDGVSYGFDATGTAQYFATPTPGEPNTSEVIESGTVEGLVISEINYNPVAPTESELQVNADFDDDDFEFVELTNTSDEAIDLSGLLFANGIGFDFSESSITTLDAGETLLLVSNQEAFEARYGTGYNIAGEFSGKLSNGGEQLTIFNAVNEAIVDCTYDDEGDWPTEADGAGYTLELVALGDDDDPSSWSIGDLGGSPGSTPSWETLVDAAIADSTA